MRICCHPLFITGCIRTWLQYRYNPGHIRVAIPYSSRVAFGRFTVWASPFSIFVAIPYSSRVAFGQPARCVAGSWKTKLPSPIHHGLHSDAWQKRSQYAKYGSCHPLFITGCIRTSLATAKVVDYHRCHPLFITGCIRTLMTVDQTPNSLMLPSPIHHGLHSDHAGTACSEILMRVAIPYSSRVAFGHMLEKYNMIYIISCHPLFITGCIRTHLGKLISVVCTSCHPLFITGCIRTLILLLDVMW